MKKIVPLILFFSLVSFAAIPQSLELYHDGMLLANGENVAVLENPSEFLITAHIGFKNISTASIPVKVKMHEVDVIEGTTHYFCFGGSCYPPGTVESAGAYTLNAGELSENQFYADYMPSGIQGTSRVKYTFFNENNVDDSICAVVSFISGYLGLTENLLNQIRLSEAYPNPANSSASFNYTLPAGIHLARLEMHNLLGSVVREAAITYLQGKITIPTADLQEGMYFYTLRAQGKSVSTGKLVIRH
ncbi:MAG TPA: T9SS type A sorting domain-containing protein [Bacteroidales bacterium]|nr:T9SS type A sorting domain-containing protein [Bacteroidales bacterium]HNS47314.1 T9SS type A sorting domain-containing protein [Bacteroidales bacterium]